MRCLPLISLLVYPLCISLYNTTGFCFLVLVFSQVGSILAGFAAIQVAIETTLNIHAILLVLYTTLTL